MTEVKDDPREVLALLNSLGFVGITAPQLKAFMKDLKMHRKIKEHQRQQRKEEMRNKILCKQEAMLKEMLRDTLAAKQSRSSENISSSELSGQQDDSLVRIRVRCVSDDEENEDIENETRHNIQAQAPKHEVHIKRDRLHRTGLHGRVEGSTDLADGRIASQRREQSKNQNRLKIAEGSTDSSQYAAVGKKQESRKGSEKPVNHNRDTTVRPVRPASAPEYTDQTRNVPKERSKSVASDPAGLNDARNNPSRCSTHSQTKSFIRPWRLQPEAQRAARSKKSDPVALYQKYRQEWKQISFPGEEQHAHVRWAIREKMLGTDPNPRPILKNSQSLLSIKKR